MGFFKKAATALAARALLRREHSSSPPRSYGALLFGSAPLQPVSEDSAVERAVADEVDSILDESSEPGSDSGDEAVEDNDPLVQTTYRQLLFNYTFVPVSALTLLVALTILLYVIARRSTSPRFHTVWRDVLVGIAAWIVSYALRAPIFALATIGSRYINSLTAALSTFIQILAQEWLRLSTFVVLGMSLKYSFSNPEWIPYPDTDDPAFRRVGYIALGWASVEVAVGIAQGYEQLSLYKDVLPGGLAHEEELAVRSPRDVLDEEVSHLMTIKHRAELEDVYGVPVPNIPIFLHVLQRIDSILLSVALTLLLSSSYLRSAVSHTLPPTPPYPFPPTPDVPQALLHTLPAFSLIVLAHFCLTLMWTEALPRIGVHTASYSALLASLALLFAGCASWGALD